MILDYINAITGYLRRSFHKCVSFGRRLLKKLCNIKLKEWQKFIFPASIIAIVWGLILLPVIFYHLPDDQKSGGNGSERCDNSSFSSGNLPPTSCGLPPQPNCSNFSDDVLVCSTDNNITQSCTIDCHDQFYCENNICKPRCDNFRENSYEYTVAADVLVAIAYSIGSICGIAILVITCLRHKRMLAFPTVLIVYLITTLLILGFSQLLTILSRAALYCKSNDLVTSIRNPTTYCTISGFILRYSTMQFMLFWVMHISFISWKIYFPINARSLNRVKYIHGICLITALLLPLISPITNHVKGGFVMANFPPFFCIGREADVTFYVHIFPIEILLGVGTSLLVLIFWKLHMQESLFRTQKSNTQLGIGTAERKVLLVFIYYIIVGVLILTTFTLEKKNANGKVKATVQFLQCEASGRNNTCEYDPPHYPTIMLMSNALLGLFPAITLVFAVNIREVKSVSKHTIKRLTKTFTTISTIETASTAP